MRVQGGLLACLHRQLALTWKTARDLLGSSPIFWATRQAVVIVGQSPVFPTAERKSGVFFSPAMPAASIYASKNSSALWWAGTSWCLPPFSWRRSHQVFPFP